MKKKEMTPKMIRQRKFLLVLPLLVLPFITVIFWALSGGSVQAVAAQTKKQEGINIDLPDAHIKDDKPMDKMSYYDLAQEDSAKFEELRKNDPNYRDMNAADTDSILLEQNDLLPEPTYTKGLNTSLSGRHDVDPNVDKIYQKLSDLNNEINKPLTPPSDYSNNGTVPESVLGDNNSGAMNSSDIDRLEQMMHTMNQPVTNDPEMQQLDGMLDKILDVQHPERMEEELKQASEKRKGQVLAVMAKPKGDNISLLHNDAIPGGERNGFYLLDDTNTTADAQNAIQAVVHETQTIVDGSTVKLRLMNDVFINGVLIPKGNFLFGTASLNGERLNVRINSVRYHNSLFPVELSVYDMDGLDGIYIPGAITRDVAKQSADRSMQTIGLTSLDPSWQAQAAGAGIEAAKTLFSKKVKLVKVTVKAGYQVLLRDEKQKQDTSN
ncbi:conjugative transposon protein TraM [Parafilimonas terrae]|uniref:Bacteroides conjugative transposon TraM protein n=1 Tax=Parafilimonas terrae TaxID=1465490 RepID=A0A1I5XEE3_9BACT|nr:conjugative transposon protein TraM [Parafilimonas terrae]SFQ30328.1 Bacteroides conjugative transposon TraM protein [Parafilimonas terrae]